MGGVGRDDRRRALRDEPAGARGEAQRQPGRESGQRPTETERHVRAIPEQGGARGWWRERVGIEPTGAAEGVSVAVLKTGQSHQARSAPLAQEGNTATASISTRAPRGQRGDGDGGARRPVVAEGAGVDRVHGGEIGHVHQEDGRLHHAGELEPLGLENGADVLEHPLGLLRDAAVHQLAGGGIEADLAGGEEQPVGADGLAVRPDGARARSGWRRSRSASEEPLDGAVGMDPDGLGGRRLAEAGHRHDLARQRDHEAGAGRGVRRRGW